VNRAIAAHHGKFGRACIYEQNRSMVPHAHREGHLVFHLRGQCATFNVSGNSIEVVGDTALAVSPLHIYDVSYNESKESALLLILYISPKWFVKAAKKPDQSLLFGSNTIEINSGIKSMMRLVTKQLIWDDDLHLIEGHLCKLTQACLDQSWEHSSGIAKSNAGKTSIPDRRIQKSVKLMQVKPFDEQIILEVAGEAGLSRAQFFKLFREHTGVTPNIYLNILRMDAAIDRLINTTDAITSIGLDLGFATQASFTRFFSANVGVPPSDYRRVTQLLV